MIRNDIMTSIMFDSYVPEIGISRNPRKCSATAWYADVSLRNWSLGRVSFALC